MDNEKFFHELQRSGYTNPAELVRAVLSSIRQAAALGKAPTKAALRAGIGKMTFKIDMILRELVPLPDGPDHAFDLCFAIKINLIN